MSLVCSFNLQALAQLANGSVNCTVESNTGITNIVGIVMEIALTVETCIYTILILLMHELGGSFHPLMCSSVSNSLVKCGDSHVFSQHLGNEGREVRN